MRFYLVQLIADQSVFVGAVCGRGVRTRAASLTSQCGTSIKLNLVNPPFVSSVL